MKRVLILLIMGAVAWLQAGEPDGAALRDGLLEAMNPEQSRAVMKQTIVTSSGDKRVLEYEAWSYKKGEMSLMRYLSPSRVRGNALLMKDFSNRIWSYNIRTKRVRLLASSAKKQKFEGSDFTYEDMGSGETWKQDYSAENRGIVKMRDVDCYELDLTALSGRDVSYRRLTCYLRVSDRFPLQIDYFDESGTKLKTLFLNDIRTIQGILTPWQLIMVNDLDKTQTSMEYEEVDYSVNLNDDFFNEMNLKR